MHREDDNTRIWMEEALKLAQIASEQDEVPVGAVVVLDDQIIGRGYNRREMDQNPMGHAELAAISEAARTLGSWRLLNCRLIVTLEPCPMCLAACQQARIEKVIYGAHDPKGGALSLGYRLHEDLRINHRFQADYVETPECARILSAFFKAKRLS